ncbi:MAG: ABC transporter substrate-binding protein [Geminicoccaceae bacterium]|nr:ABC transporter substrate-binding protein [Geminicoccaceae bacterium]
MTRRRTALALALGTTLGLAIAGANPSAAADPVRIGDINSYTRMAAFTEPYRMGMELALAEINEAGGAGGRMLELVSRDDAGEPGEAVKIAEEMITRDRVALLSGGFFSNVGLALASLAEQRGVLYLAGEPLADSLVWEDGNRHTFRLRPSTWMQAAMLAREAAASGARRWATIAPNYAYGKDAVAAFKAVLSELQPEVEFVAEQWPALFKIDAGAEVQALAAARPDAIYNVTFGTDMAKFAREGEDRGLFEDRLVLGLLGGEPEYIEPLGEDAPIDWLVTGYPWSKIDTAAHAAFRDAYIEKFDDHPRAGSLVGYNVIKAIGALLEKTGGDTATDGMIEAMEDLTFETPVGPVTFRAIDHQSTMGAYVGYTALEEGRPTMRDWYYADGADYLPDDEAVRARRPAE